MSSLSLIFASTNHPLLSKHIARENIDLKQHLILKEDLQPIRSSIIIQEKFTLNRSS